MKTTVPEVVIQVCKHGNFFLRIYDCTYMYTYLHTYKNHMYAAHWGRRTYIHIYIHACRHTFM